MIDKDRSYLFYTSPSLPVSQPRITTIKSSILPALPYRCKDTIQQLYVPNDNVTQQSFLFLAITYPSLLYRSRSILFFIPYPDITVKTIVNLCAWKSFALLWAQAWSFSLTAQWRMGFASQGCGVRPAHTLQMKLLQWNKSSVWGGKKLELKFRLFCLCFRLYQSFFQLNNVL